MILLPSTHSVAAVTLVQTLALIPPLLVTAWGDPAAVVPILAAAGLTAAVWEMLFAGLRQRTAGFHGITTALVVAILVPPDVALWQIAVATSLGVVLGELIFGGRGFGFVSPATLTLSLLVVSFPQVALREPGAALALATLPGAVLLLALGLISLRVVLGVAISVMAAAAATGLPVDAAALATALAFGVTFLVCDPVSAAATPAGRWLHGLLAGGLVVILSPGDGLTTAALVAAALLASVFAPLIDHVVVLAHARRRRVRRRA